MIQHREEHEEQGHAQLRTPISAVSSYPTATYKLLSSARACHSVLSALARLIFSLLTSLLVFVKAAVVNRVSLVYCAHLKTDIIDIITTATTNTTTTTTTTTSATMTIEVPAEYSPPASVLPVLRINSVNLSDPLLDDSAFILSASSSDGEEPPESPRLYGREQEEMRSDLSSSNEESGQLLSGGDSDDTGDASSNDGSAEDAPAPEVSSRIIAQVENMFSDDHLAKDGFLLKHVRRRSDGFVSLKLVAGLRKVKQISREFPAILNALKCSEKLEVNDEGTKIRRVEPLTPLLKGLPIASQKNNNKEKEVLSKSPSSSGDDLPGRNGNGAVLHFSTNFSLTAENNKENKRQSGRNTKASRNSKDFGHRKISNQHSDSSQGNDNEREVVIRRRGGSLPIAMTFNNHHHQRNTSSHLSPNSSPPNSFLPSRPKSNSYCEGLTTTTTMSPWLQRRKAASEGNVIISSIIRQPRGPDGTRGFTSAHLSPLIRVN